MILIKKGEGTAKHFADLAIVNILLLTTDSNNKHNLLDKYLLDYKFFNSKITAFLHSNSIDSELMFNDYISSEKFKRIEVKKGDKKEYKDELQYYYIEGRFSLEIPIIDNDRGNVAKLIAILDDLIGEDLQLCYSVNLTLSDDTRARMTAEATNNAIDSINIEIAGIAKHLNKTNYSLVELNFECSDNVYGSVNAMCKTSASMELSRAEKVGLLDEMLESKEIEVSSKFLSKWELC